MPRIPTRQAPTVAPTVAPAGVPLPAGLFAAEQQATAQAAQNLGELGASMFKLQRSNEISNGQLDYEAMFSEFKLGLLEDTDYESHNKKFAQFHAKETASILGKTKNRGAKDRLGQFFTDRKTNNGASVHISAFRQQAREAIQIMPVKIEQYQNAIVQANTVDERMRLEEEMTIYLTGLQESGLFSEQVLDAQIADAQAGVDEAVQASAIDSEFALARSIYDSTQDQTAALDVIRNSEIIPEDKKQEIQSDLVSEIGYRKAEDKKALEQEQTRESESVYGRLNSGNVSGVNDFIDNLPATTEKRKAELKKIAKDHAKSALQDKLDESLINQFDPVAYQNLKFRVRNDPASITNVQIADFVGKGRDGGITTGQYDEISNLHDKKLTDLQSPGQDPLQDDSVKRAQSQIGRMRTIALKDVDEATAKATEFDYQVIQNQLDEFAEKLKPDDPDFAKKIENETQRLLTPQVEQVQLNTFQRMLLHKEGGVGAKVFGEKAVTEESALVDKKLKRLKEQDVFGRMSDAQKDQARRAFIRGATVNQVIDAVLSDE